jgi:hypothetical protein
VRADHDPLSMRGAVSLRFLNILDSGSSDENASVFFRSTPRSTARHSEYCHTSLSKFQVEHGLLSWLSFVRLTALISVGHSKFFLLRVGSGPRAEPLLWPPSEVIRSIFDNDVGLLQHRRVFSYQIDMERAAPALVMIELIKCL